MREKEPLLCLPPVPPSFASVQVFLSVALVKLLESIANLFKASIFP